MLLSEVSQEPKPKLKDVRRLIEKNIGDIGKLEGHDGDYFELFHAKVAQYDAEYEQRLMITSSWRYNVGRLICNVGKHPKYTYRNVKQFLKFAYKKSGARTFFVRRKANKTFRKVVAKSIQKGQLLEAAGAIENLRDKIPQTEVTLLWNQIFDAIKSKPYQDKIEFMRAAYADSPNPQLAKILAKQAFRYGDITFSMDMVQTWLKKSEPDNETDVRWLRIFKGWCYLFHSDIEVPEKVYEHYEPIPEKCLYFLHNSLPIHSGGYATRTHNLLLGLTDLGYTMEAYTRLGYPNDQFTKQDGQEEAVSPVDEVDGIKYHRIFGGGVGYRRMPIDSYMMAASKIFETRIAEQRPSIVHAASNFYTGLPACLAAKKFGIPFVYEVRGLWEITRISREPKWANTDHFRCYKRLETTVARLADKVLTLNNALKQELIERGVDADKIEIVPNSVFPDRFLPIAPDEELRARLGIHKDEVVIGFIGTFAEYEGLDDLIKAFALLKEKGCSFKALMVGDGAVSGLVKELVAKYNLGDKVIITGRVPHEQVNKYYSLVDICPYPRKPQLVAEMVTPMKPFEAMSMEKVVLVSSVAAMAEFVNDGETGFVFTKGSVESLASTLEKLIADKELRIRVGANARKWVKEERTWSHSAAVISSVYKELLQKGH